MKVIEQYCIGKFNDESLNEDCIFVSDDYIAVIDGVTTKSDRRYHGMKSGKVASIILKKAFEEMPKQLSGKEVVQRLNKAIETFANSCDPIATGNEIPRASVIFYSHYEHMIYSYGDSQCYLNGQVYQFEHQIDHMNSLLRKYVLELGIMDGFDLDEMIEKQLDRKVIQPFLDQQYRFENSPSFFGYPVINGTPIADSYLASFKVQANQEVILASDGYPCLKETLVESENELKRILKEDPHCMKEFLSTKGLSKNQISFDDRSFIRFVC